MASQDTEITLGTGKMLALFFGLVMLCAVFFGLGFSLGKNSAHPFLSTDSSGTAAGPGVRPAASKSTGNAGSQTDGLTFYKAVEQKEAEPALNEPAAKTPLPSAPAETPTAQNPGAPPDPMNVAAPSGGSYFVQVAAVSKQDDAQALVEALRKKQYSAFANNAPSDKLYHVQIGPFSDVKDAELTRAKLVGDGYNPILKK
jgi:cell division septation protein DedD